MTSLFRKQAIAQRKLVDSDPSQSLTTDRKIFQVMSIKLCLFRNILCSLIECGVACNSRVDDCNVFWIKDGVCKLGNIELKI